jgi:PAS domain S-box-containing protein
VDERNVTLARDAANEPPYLIQVFQDIDERKRTEAQLERLRRARDLLARCNRALMHASVESHLLNEVCRIAVDAGGFKQAWIGLATGESKRGVQVAAHAGYERDRPPMSSAAMWAADGRYRGKMAEVVRTGALRIERDVLGEERDNFQRDHARRLGWGSSAAFALAADGFVLGAIEFNAREVDAFDGDEIALLSELAADLSFGIGALRTRRARAEAEAQIHAQERRYQETFDKAPVGIMHTAFEDNQILRANRRLAEMLGYTEAELLQLKSTDLVHFSMRGNDGPRYRQRLVEGDSETHASERLYLHKQGWTIWVNRTVSLVKDAAGKPDYYIRIIEDISERILSARRRAMEHAVAKTLAEATSVEEAMPALIRTMCETSDWCYGAHWCWSNAESKLVRSAHWSDCEMRFADAEEERRWIRLYLRNRSGLVGGAWHEGRPQWIQDIQGNTAFQRRFTALRFGFHSALSFPIIAGVETIGSMEFFAREVRKPDEVLLQTVGSIGRQIGQFIQRKQAEQALRASEERYRDIFESSPLPMWVRDDQTRAIITVNQAAIDHYGYSREEFLGMNVRDLWDPSEQATYEEDGRSAPGIQSCT